MSLSFIYEPASPVCVSHIFIQLPFCVFIQIVDFKRAPWYGTIDLLSELLLTYH